MTEPLKPCPFCGGRADFEAMESGRIGTWSVGCQNTNEDCIGYQMMAHYSRKGEAAMAWNKRYLETKNDYRIKELEAEIEQLKKEIFNYKIRMV